MITQPNSKKSIHEIVEEFRARNSPGPAPQITENVAGFPASVLERLRKVEESFDTNLVLPFVRAGADIFAPLPGVEISYGDLVAKQVVTLENATMFAMIQFRGKIENANFLRPHYPKKPKCVPDAGRYIVRSEQGDVLADRQINVLEYAAVTGRYQMISQFLSSPTFVDTRSEEVRAGVTRALDVFVRGAGIGVPQPLDQFEKLRTNSVMSMIRAGADLDVLQYLWKDAQDAPQVRLLRLLIKTLAGAKPSVIDMNVKIGADAAAEIESAIEKLTTPDPLTYTVPFDIDWRDPKTGSTLLHDAVDFASPKVVQLLLHAGADVDAELPRKRPNMDPTKPITPLSLAEAAGAHDIVSVLQVWKAKRAITNTIGGVLDRLKQRST